MLIKDINFFERYKEEQKKEKNVSKDTTVKIAIVAGTAVVVGAVSSVFNVMNMSIQGQITDIDNYINSPQVVEKLEVLTTKQTILDNVTNYNLAINSANSKINSQVKPDTALVAGIVKLLPANTVITKYTYSAGTIQLECKSDKEDSLAKYVHALRGATNIASVSYSGYDLKEASDYETKIQISLKPGGAKDATQQ